MLWWGKVSFPGWNQGIGVSCPGDHTALQHPGKHWTGRHCTALHCTALHYTTLHYTALHCTALNWTALHCKIYSRPMNTFLNCTISPLICHNKGKQAAETIETNTRFIMLVAMKWWPRCNFKKTSQNLLFWKTISIPHQGEYKNRYTDGWTDKIQHCVY